MKNVKLIISAALLWQFGLTSCKKLEVEKKENSNSTEIKKFTEIKTSKEFTWSTNKTIAIDFPARANDARVAVLKVTDANGVVYFKKLQKANEKFTGSIQVPSHVKTLSYVYGGIKKEFSTNNPSLTIDLK
ncbi:MAG: hypothetical protein MH472_03195 [Bacteroidia bacterium]|nr:hypothetical protein [Bacteroidia bacterium]